MESETDGSLSDIDMGQTEDLKYFDEYIKIFCKKKELEISKKMETTTFLLFNKHGSIRFNDKYELDYLPMTLVRGFVKIRLVEYVENKAYTEMLSQLIPSYKIMLDEFCQTIDVLDWHLLGLPKKLERQKEKLANKGKIHYAKPLPAYTSADKMEIPEIPKYRPCSRDHYPFSDYTYPPRIPPSPSGFQPMITKFLRKIKPPELMVPGPLNLRNIFPRFHPQSPPPATKSNYTVYESEDEDTGETYSTFNKFNLLKKYPAKESLVELKSESGSDTEWIISDTDDKDTDGEAEADQADLDDYIANRENYLEQPEYSNINDWKITKYSDIEKTDDSDYTY